MLKLDVTKAADLLHWQPVWSIDRALDATAEWYTRFVRGAKATRVLHTLDQIDEYVLDAAQLGVAWALDRGQEG